MRILGLICIAVGLTIAASGARAEEVTVVKDVPGPDGKLLHVFPIAAGDGTTNVAFGPGGHELSVTVMKDPNDPKALGSIVRIPNVE